MSFLFSPVAFRYFASISITSFCFCFATPSCPKWNEERKSAERELKENGIQSMFVAKTVIGLEGVAKQKQKDVIEILAKYLTATGLNKKLTSPP